jgi:hypothetical protein
MSEPLSVLSPAPAHRSPWVSQSWLHARALETLAELNEQCLELLCDQAAACSGRPRPVLLAGLEALWSGLDTAARRRAARCPFLLLDAGFTCPGSLPWQRALGVRDLDGPSAREAFFTVPRTIQVARLVLIYAWHLARSENVAARLFLGMSARCAERVAGCTLRQVIQVAESEPRVLEPRWFERLGVWRELLIAAASAEPSAMERFRMRGLQLLAAQALDTGERSAEYVK